MSIWMQSPSKRVSSVDPDNTAFSGHSVGANVSLWPGHYERADPSNCMCSELFQPSECPLSWTCEQKDKGEVSIRKSLDKFYGACCQKKSSGGSPAYEVASQCLSVKIADLADKEGMKYAQKSLQIAQMVLNQDENQVFPQHSSSTCFSIPTKASVTLEEGKQMPGLSDDVLRFILKQNVTK
ncbi:shieldin complex subunit 1 isoform X2 [Rhineura floridana]|uniref:shieldin complex subunit 1 isoform X2 n=1 Tax=Rhineura floridana TaxID=261503 RepID=UPI002AC86A2A|nr:shieldin complex subunit 1 isoform X2 [Rhineura floridana]XP_061478478.1 shieldin complex subunit 1 isoform X2 [Rhineura floridana]XP_061478479.1 shieldin complex subunit 1 isoform X2 [Rhineura floridana]XP_061478481.1 shieldin complex subunit 1 isoform X2 [Rhineura floridana]XP_061478482.1 shieldin complex subunit 1 isoform X2 [Rhineura floridana]XP_061478483.1 shieldin complex subunit 1 isoform X2 [Rhineura floridana]XP_061478484.1 shieldin complex subunit 1 isoform X2 [Rhineura floridan